MRYEIEREKKTQEKENKQREKRRKTLLSKGRKDWEIDSVLKYTG